MPFIITHLLDMPTQLGWLSRFYPALMQLSLPELFGVG